jgi:hypothetical protein
MLRYATAYECGPGRFLRDKLAGTPRCAPYPTSFNAVV